MELPEGYLAYEKKLRAGKVWYGVIQHIVGGKEITYYTGAVQNAIRDDNTDIILQRYLTTTYGTIKYAVEKNGEKLRLLAENRGVNFETDIGSVSEIEEMLMIIKIVRDGTCTPCIPGSDEVGRPTLRRRPVNGEQ